MSGFELTEEEINNNCFYMKSVNKNISINDTKTVIKNIQSDLKFLDFDNFNLTDYCNLNLYIIYYFSFNELRSSNIYKLIHQHDILIYNMDQGKFYINKKFEETVTRVLERFREFDFKCLHKNNYLF